MTGNGWTIDKALVDLVASRLRVKLPNERAAAFDAFVAEGHKVFADMESWQLSATKNAAIEAAAQRPLF